MGKIVKLTHNFSEQTTVRMTLKEISQNHEYDENKNILINKKIVSLFYFRAGYSEKEYLDDVKFKLILGLLERARSCRIINSNKMSEYKYLCMHI